MTTQGSKHRASPVGRGPTLTPARRQVAADAPLRIVLGVPDWQPLARALNDEPADATYVIQANLAKALRGRGHELTLVAPCDLSDVMCANAFGADAHVLPRTWTRSAWFELASKVVWQSQRIVGLPFLNVFSNCRYYDAFRQALSGADVVYERNDVFNVGLAMAARRCGLPYVVFVEADQIMELDLSGAPVTGVLRWRAKQAFRFNLRAADIVVCVSAAGCRHLIQNWHVDPRKVVELPNAVDVSRFRPDPVTRASVRSWLGLGDRDPLVLFVGNFFPWHDVETLLQAFAFVLAALPNARLLLVGDGARREAMMRRADALGLQSAVRFTGIVAHGDVPRFTAAADVAVVPYPVMSQEMWMSPLKLFEYMASGRAIVASSVGQINTVIEDGVNGLLVPPGDVTALARALTSVVQDSVLRTRLGVKARQDAVRCYGWDAYLSRLEAVFSAAIARQPVTAI